MTKESKWGSEELKIFRKLGSPRKIQDYLDKVIYSTDEFYRSPRRVIHDQRAHCFDGCLFAAAALRFIGFPPLIVDLLAYNDDEHMLAIYKVNNNFGAVAKSNFTGLRFREPVYRNLRELVLSYFNDYYNLDYIRSLRGYTVPLNLERFDYLNWMFSDEHLDDIADATETLRKYNLLTKKQLAYISPIDQRTYDAGMLGVVPEGIYVPKKN
jgi:hypothetical protein